MPPWGPADVVSVGGVWERRGCRVAEHCGTVGWVCARILPR